MSSVQAKQVDWEFIGVVDGDTLKFMAHEFPEPLRKMSIRIDGIDTPESTYRAKCEREKLHGIQAKVFVKNIISQCPPVASVTGWGKYGGRALGNIHVCGADLKDLLIKHGYARPYDGGKKSDWCN